jgi:gluconolactonase
MANIEHQLMHDNLGDTYLMCNTSCETKVIKGDDAKSYIFSPEGKHLQKIETPGTKPTNLEFGDEDYKTLYLTEVETNALYKIRTSLPGKRLYK